MTIWIAIYIRNYPYCNNDMDQNNTETIMITFLVNVFLWR